MGFVDASIRRDYNRLWEDARPALLRGDVQPDPVPVDGGMRWGISAILTPRGATAE